MYVNENMSGVSNVLAVMKAKHHITKNSLVPLNISMLNHESLLKVTRVNNLFTKVIPLTPVDSFISDSNQKSESLNPRGFHLTNNNFSILLNNKIQLL
jgi:hypothetical protein